ncbi:MAG: HU family DNA-binding protein [Deltaproteobacteria bacterium]|nr:HU family DNA-binding protein [Deltaproteobacteria bacterium]
MSKKETLKEKQTTEIVNLIFDGFANELKNGGRIEIRGFGSFVVREYDSYEGRNALDNNTFYAAVTIHY